MPTDIGAFDVARLRKLAERSFWRSSGALATSVDEVMGVGPGVACVALGSISTPDAGFAKMLQDSAEVNELLSSAERLDLERHFLGSRARRDWYLACGTDMANVWYRCRYGDAVAADLVECEEMVRSIRFDGANV